VMNLLTEELKVKFPKLKKTEGKNLKDIKVIAKFFDPCSQWTWYATEYDPTDRIFFGLVRGHETEMGYFSLDELESVKGALGLGIERDLYFSNHTLAEALEKAI